jgi:hypothetical protein
VFNRSVAYRDKKVVSVFGRFRAPLRNAGAVHLCRMAWRVAGCALHGGAFISEYSS